MGAHRSGRGDHKRLLYCLLELAEWQDIFGGAQEGLAHAA